MLEQLECRITEIFYSLQGESSLTGWPTVFIRLTGCPLRCNYCDTAYAFHGGHKQSLAQILETVRSYRAQYVCVTGGEPLAQKNVYPLMQALADGGWTVSLETSGALDVSAVDDRVIRVIDFKTPGSDESSRNLMTNFTEQLRSTDQIKFVISDRDDYLWSVEQVKAFNLTAKAQVLFSPRHPEQSPQALADWIVADQLLVRFQHQLHKQLWGDVPGK